MSKKDNLLSVASDFIYTPQQAATAAFSEVETLRSESHRAVEFPVPVINEYFSKLLPGQICAIIAQTSNYKTGTIDFWAESLARQLQRQGRTDEVILKVSVEDTIEEQIIGAMARESNLDAADIVRGDVQDWGELERAAMRVANIPIYRIGESLARSQRQLPELHLSNMVRCIDYLVGTDPAESLLGYPIKLAAIFWDYLQAFPYDPEIRAIVQKDQQRRLQVADDIRRIRQLSARLRVPSIVGVQAKQDLKGAPPNWQLPSDYDGIETSAIAYLFDRIVTQWMPKRTHTLGTIIEHGNVRFSVEENILIMKVAKQRGKLPSGKAWKCRINWLDGSIAPEAE